MEAVATTPFDCDKIAVLNEASMMELTPLGEYLRGAEKRWWSNPTKYMLLPEAGQEAARADPSAPHPYWDPRLLRNRSLYLDLVMRLFRWGLVTFRRGCRGRVGVFSVGKKSNVGFTQRLILDCRLVNSLFFRPPKTQVTARSQLGEVSLPTGERLVIAGGDVPNAFYSWGQHADLIDFFRPHADTCVMPT